MPIWAPDARHEKNLSRFNAFGEPDGFVDGVLSATRPAFNELFGNKAGQSRL
jgi:hypothetical protein